MSKKRGIAGDSDAQGKMRKDEALRSGRADRDAQAVMSTAEGRRFVKTLIFDVALINKLSYTPGSTESTVFWEGRRSVGLDIQTFVRAAAPEQYVALMAEDVQEAAEDIKKAKIVKHEFEGVEDE